MNRESIWARGSQVLFGQMYEDVEIERRVFAGRARVFCIASAGCTAIALSEDHEVTAVDINADQLRYARERARGLATQIGRAERLMEGGRILVRIAGWTPERLQRFVKIASCDEQMTVWRSELDRPLFRVLFDKSLAAALFGLRLFTPPGSQLPMKSLSGTSFGKIMRSRLERSLARHPNAANPYAASLFIGARLVRGSAVKAVKFQHADAAAYLEASPAGSFDAFTLSNILDGATESYGVRLRAAVRKAAASGARVMLRSFLEPGSEHERKAAAEDRSMLWGAVYIGPAESF